MEKIAATGTLITEYAPGTDPLGKNFPIRNRIISGLCQGTVVVEADQRSGSLITAKKALQQGRDLFAFPGKANDPNYTGTNALIQNGATLVTCARDILLDYEPLYPGKIMTDNIAMEGYKRKVRREEQARILCSDFTDMPKQDADISESNRNRFVENEDVKKKPASIKRTPEDKNKTASDKNQDTEAQVKKRDLSGLGEYEREIISVMTDAMSVEEITAALAEKHGEALDMGGVLGALTMLELEAYIESMPGGIYRLTE